MYGSNQATPVPSFRTIEEQSFPVVYKIGRILIVVKDQSTIVHVSTELPQVQ
jgi:hypothetical protein